MDLSIPKLSLVVLIGPSGSGKSTFARTHFLGTEILSSDYCRGLVSDDENCQEATSDAFEVLHFIAAKRLAAGRLTVIDATNVQEDARKPLVALARRYHCLPVAIVFNLPEKLCQQRNEERPDRDFGRHVIRQHRMQLRKSLRSLKREGFRHIHILTSEEEVNSVSISRVPLWNDRTEEHGPFDVIGDVHGCFDELTELLAELGYVATENDSGEHSLSGPVYAHPEGRKAVFLGDIVDRGPKVLDCLRLVYSMVHSGNALCVPGNHEMKLMRKLWGKNVQVRHGLETTLAEIDAVPEEHQKAFRKDAADFIRSLVSHYVLDEGKLVVAHAGLKEEMQGRGSGKVREFCLYGETTGETDEFGLPERLNWALEYRGKRTVVYGHTPVPEAEWLNRTVNIDTGCVFGGKLTALRYPEREFVAVEARKTYCEPVRPVRPDETTSELTAQQVHDDVLDAEDVSGKRFISTRLRPNIKIREENATAALEVMSRFAVDPKWLIYLPPTMSPSETSDKDGYLEYPTEAFSYYRSRGVPKIVCEQKHMGSRAVVIVCKDGQVARTRFGVQEETLGIIYTRTGRRFFEDPAMETAFLERIRAALSASKFWDEFNTDWVCLDSELMPWSAKAQELLRTQYAAVGTAAAASLDEAILQLQETARRNDLIVAQSDTRGRSSKNADIKSLLEKYKTRKDLIGKYIKAYAEYCWKVESLEDLKLAPFHVLATEGKVHVDADHQWHMEVLARLCAEEPAILLATPYRIVDLTDPASADEAAGWWEKLTDNGGEGMVVKPSAFIARGKRGILQPALKCRGREYLRIIYGPEYTIEKNLLRLRNRGLNAKRSLAIREFALGIEALERFVRREPLRRVHECVFGVLALESEPVDPRL
jgi:protein phosphatase